MLEKSPEMTVFISEKDLSPPNPLTGDNHSNRKSRIEYLRDKTNRMYDEEREKDEVEGSEKNNSMKVFDAEQIFEDIYENKDAEL